MNLIAKDQLQKKIEIANWIILSVLFIPSLIFAPLKFALGVLLGGFISILNFYWMKRSLNRVFEKLSGNIKGAVVFKYFIRLTLTAIILYFLISGKISFSKISIILPIFSFSLYGIMFEERKILF